MADRLTLYRGRDPIIMVPIQDGFDFRWEAHHAGQAPLDGVSRIDLARDPHRVTVSRSDLLLLVRWAGQEGAGLVWHGPGEAEDVQSVLRRLAEVVRDG